MAQNHNQASLIFVGVASIVLAAVLLAFAFPIGINEMNAQEETNITQAEGEEVVLIDDLNSTVNNVEDPLLDNPSANITLEDTNTGDSKTVIIDEGATEYVEINGANVTVNNYEHINDTHVDIHYKYPERYFWDDNTRNIYNVMGLIMIVTAVFILMGSTLKTFKAF